MADGHHHHQADGGETNSDGKLTARGVHPSFRGEVLHPGDANYEACSKLWNANYQHKPSIIIRPLNTRDVQSAVLWAQKNNVSLTVKCGGHSLKGTSVQDGIPLLDLGLMRSVRVNPKKQYAWVGGGCLLGDVDTETTAHDLATPLGQIPHTGVGGLVSGGGYGYLTRLHGLSVDNVIAAEVVTADGSILQVSSREDQHPDLFWGIRGGGGNFGIITAFKLKLHKLHRAADGTHGLAGTIIYDFSNAKRVTELLSAIMKDAPRNLCTHYTLANPPPLNFQLVAIVTFVWLGEQEEGHKHLQRFLTDEEAKPLMNTVHPMRYEEIQKMNEPIAPIGLEYYISFRYLKNEALSNGDFANLLQRLVAKKPPTCAVQLENFGGAGCEPDHTETCFIFRKHEWILGFIGVVRPGAPFNFEMVRAWVKEALKESDAITEISGYGNLVGSDELDVDTPTVFGTSYARLKALKLKYDPKDFFTYVTNHVV
eukprot:TRINITY_DN809_c0_g2_i2.p1 TRINITY_DN809_c0_g2~~TRINITY_DN809_c0_g2_i2.p1  ORF type:complete len:519 (-),score=108.61 TRINITY_DN809_c0_g2_i2:68-1513(-)